jgi:hypothetical protein
MQPSSDLARVLLVDVVVPAIVYGMLVAVFRSDATVGQRVRAQLILVGAHLASLTILAGLFAATQPAPYFQTVGEMFLEITRSPVMQLAIAPLMAFPVWSVLSGPPEARDRRVSARPRTEQVSRPTTSGSHRADPWQRRKADAVRPGAHTFRVETRDDVPVVRTNPWGQHPQPATMTTRAAPEACPGDPPHEATKTVGAADETVGGETRRRHAAPPSDVIRVRFARIESQLPAEAFACSVGAVGPELSTPGYVTVARALVLPQLSEGMVTVPWSAIAEQFPDRVLIRSAAEITAHLVDGRLSLPLDEVVAQCWSEITSDDRPCIDLAPLARFPEPFHPATRGIRPDGAASFHAAPSPVMLAAAEAIGAELSVADAEDSESAIVAEQAVADAEDPETGGATADVDGEAWAVVDAEDSETAGAAADVDGAEGAVADAEDRETGSAVADAVGALDAGDSETATGLSEPGGSAQRVSDVLARGDAIVVDAAVEPEPEEWRPPLEERHDAARAEGEPQDTSGGVVAPEEKHRIEKIMRDLAATLDERAARRHDDDGVLRGATESATPRTAAEGARDVHELEPAIAENEAVGEAVRGLLKSWRAMRTFTCDAYAIAGRMIITLAGNGHRSGDLALMADRLASMGPFAQVNVTHCDGAVVVMRGNGPRASGPLVTASVDPGGSLALAELLCRRVTDKCGATTSPPTPRTGQALPPFESRRVATGAGAVYVAAPSGTDLLHIGALARRLYASVTALADAVDVVGRPDEVSGRLLDGSWFIVRPLDGACGLVAVVTPGTIPRGQTRCVMERAARRAKRA